MITRSYISPWLLLSNAALLLAGFSNIHCYTKPSSCTRDAVASEFNNVMESARALSAKLKGTPAEHIINRYNNASWNVIERLAQVDCFITRLEQIAGHVAELPSIASMPNPTEEEPLSWGKSVEGGCADCLVIKIFSEEGIITLSHSPLTSHKSQDEAAEKPTAPQWFITQNSETKTATLSDFAHIADTINRLYGIEDEEEPTPEATPATDQTEPDAHALTENQIPPTEHPYEKTAPEDRQEAAHSPENVIPVTTDFEQKTQTIEPN